MITPLSAAEAAQFLEYLLATSALVDLLAREYETTPEVDFAMVRWQDAIYNLPASCTGGSTVWLAELYAAGPFETLAPG